MLLLNGVAEHICYNELNMHLYSITMWRWQVLTIVCGFIVV